MKEFEEQVPATTHFLVGYFVGRQSTKKWLVTQEDLAAMYLEHIQESETHVCGVMDHVKKWRKRKRDDGPGFMSKHAEKERDIKDLVTELKQMH